MPRLPDGVVKWAVIGVPGNFKDIKMMTYHVQLKTQGDLWYAVGVLALFAVLLSHTASAAAIPQRTIRAIAHMPDMPHPYNMRNWSAASQKLYSLIFDPNARGPFLPLIHIGRNSRRTAVSFAIPSYADRRINRSNKGEALTDMGAIWGATLLGFDMAGRRINYVRMLKNFFDPHLDHGVFGDGYQSASPQSTAWYTVFPDITAAAISARYPADKRFSTLCRDTAESWADAIKRFRSPDGEYDFNYTGFNFSTMRPVYNGVWREPNMAAGLAWLEFMAWERWHRPEFLKAAKACMDFLESLPRSENPSWEIMTPFGALAAARMNARLGTHYPERKLLHWCFSYYHARPSWGVEIGQWAGQDVGGLIGAVNQGPANAWASSVHAYMDTKGKELQHSPWRPWGTGGYAFFLETATQLWALAPLARYDQRYAAAMGKWLLNAANASRLFYGKFHSAANQSDPGWRLGESLISYEGLKYRRDYSKQPLIATGDNKTFMDPGYRGYHTTPGTTNYALYGGVYMGVFGALVQKTNVLGILQINLRATDTFPAPGYPTFLLYNPYPHTKTVRINVGTRSLNLYNTISGTFIAHDISGETALSIPGKKAVVVVYTPAHETITYRGDETLVDGWVIDFRHEGRLKE
jgi:hypothetical protein